MKFKAKKKRTYRGYRDDGFKLVQQIEGSEDLLHINNVL